MKTYLVTGGAGFIGSNFIHYMLRRNQDIHILNVDALTYAGNLENLSEYDQDPRYTFAHVDIRDKEALTQLFETYHPDYVVNFAAESHVDRSIEDPGAFADTNVMGTVTLLSTTKLLDSKLLNVLRVCKNEVLNEVLTLTKEHVLRRVTSLVCLR